jgi:hypothetical protein
MKLGLCGGFEEPELSGALEAARDQLAGFSGNELNGL